MPELIVAALDIGGSKIAATVADKTGPLLRVTQCTAKSGNEEAVPRQALQLVDAACSAAGIAPSSVQRLGVSSCGPFAKRGQCLTLETPNLCGGLAHSEDLPNDWKAIPLEQVLRTRFAHLAIENDCVAAVVAERSFGGAQDEPNCAYVTWSTGIGFGLCVDGHVLHGKNGNAGHAGHMLLDERSDSVCGCGNRGDLEALVSGRNLKKRHGRPAAEIFEAAAAGDAASLEIVREAAHWFGVGLYNLATTLDTRYVMVGGSVWRHHARMLEPMVQAEIKGRFPALSQGVVVVGADLGELVTDIGALALVMPAEWRTDWRARSPWNALQSVPLDAAAAAVEED